MLAAMALQRKLLGDQHSLPRREPPVLPSIIAVNLWRIRRDALVVDATMCERTSSPYYDRFELG